MDDRRVAAAVRRLRQARALTRRAARLARRSTRRLAGRVRRRWRRSLQIRVVATTLVISASTVAVLGFFLMQQIETDLLQAKERSARSETATGRSMVQNIQLGPGSVGEKLEEFAEALGRRSAGLYEVVILTPESIRSATDGGRKTAGIDPVSVPDRLRRSVATERETNRGDIFTTYTVLRYTDSQLPPVPGLAVGAPAGSYDLYLLFPLTQERETLRFVERAMFAVGAALVLLLAAIASLVTRWVVVPVRLAAQAAQRLSSGHLDERMQVRGEDDLARLARSFNRMGDRLQEKIRELEELSQVQRQFVSDVSHELRTPLTTIRIAADVLYESRQHFEPQVARSSELLQSQLERFETLLADLLEISRYDAGAATLEAESVDVRDLVLRAVGDTEHIAQRRETKVVLRLPAEPCIAEVDRRRVERILRNLLVNAVEHGEGREVVVTAAADRDCVAIAVRDHGVGLRRGEENMVFDRFWRADPARARTTGGTGLGLSIALEDARLHGGWLQAWGEPGHGSQFRLSLPRVAGAELQGTPLALVPPEIDLARRAAVPLPGPPGDLAPAPPAAPSSPGPAPAASAGPAPAASPPAPAVPAPAVPAPAVAPPAAPSAAAPRPSEAEADLAAGADRVRSGG